MPDVHIVLLGTPLKLNTTYLVSSEVPFFSREDIYGDHGCCIGKKELGAAPK